MRYAPWLAIGLLAMTAALTACGGETEATARAPLHADVVRYADSVRVIVRDPEAPDACTNGFPELGVSDSDTDVYDCQPALATWVERVELVQGDTVLDEDVWDPPDWPGFALSAGGDAIVFVGDEGDRHSIPVPDAADLAVTIDDVQVAPGGIGTDTYTITWSAAGASSAIVAIGGGFGGPRVHATAGAPAELSYSTQSAIADLYVQAFTAAETSSAEIGEVHVWRSSDFVTLDLNTL